MDAVSRKNNPIDRHAEFGRSDKSHAAADLDRCIVSRHAVEIGARGGGGGRGVGHLIGGRGADLNTLDVDLKNVGNDLCNLDEQPLPHLGTAVIEMDAAVGIDVHEGARLVEPRDVEGNAEFDGEGGEPLADHRARPVEGVDGSAPLGERGIRRKLRLQGRDDVVLDRLAIGRRRTRRLPVIIAFPHRRDRKPQMTRDLLDHDLRPDHPLRAAEAAESGVRHGVGLAGIAAQSDMGEEIDVVDMAERAAQHRGR